MAQRGLDEADAPEIEARAAKLLAMKRAQAANGRPDTPLNLRSIDLGEPNPKRHRSDKEAGMEAVLRAADELVAEGQPSSPSLIGQRTGMNVGTVSAYITKLRAAGRWKYPDLRGRGRGSGGRPAHRRPAGPAPKELPRPAAMVVNAEPEVMPVPMLTASTLDDPAERLVRALGRRMLAWLAEIVENGGA